MLSVLAIGQYIEKIKFSLWKFLRRCLMLLKKQYSKQFENYSAWEPFPCAVKGPCEFDHMEGTSGITGAVLGGATRGKDSWAE